MWEVTRTTFLKARSFDLEASLCISGCADTPVALEKGANVKISSQFAKSGYVSGSSRRRFRWSCQAFHVMSRIRILPNDAPGAYIWPQVDQASLRTTPPSKPAEARQATKLNSRSELSCRHIDFSNRIAECQQRWPHHRSLTHLLPIILGRYQCRLMQAFVMSAVKMGNSSETT